MIFVISHHIVSRCLCLLVWFNNSKEDSLDIHEDVIDYDNDNYDNNDDVADDAGGFCQPYLGLTCSKFVGNRSVFVRSRYEQGLIEEQLAGTHVACLSSHTEYAAVSAAIMPIPVAGVISLVVCRADACPVGQRCRGKWTSFVLEAANH